MNSIENVWGITEKTNEVLPILNLEEADIRLIFQERMKSKAAVIAARDMDIILPVVYASEQLECFLPPWCIDIDSNQFIKIKMIYDNLVSEVSDVVLEFNVQKVQVFKNVCKDSSGC